MQPHMNITGRTVRVFFVGPDAESYEAFFALANHLRFALVQALPEGGFEMSVLTRMLPTPRAHIQIEAGDHAALRAIVSVLAQADTVSAQLH